MVIAGGQEINAYGSMSARYYPRCYWASVILPDSPITATGFRIKHNETIYRHQIWLSDDPWVTDGYEKFDYIDNFISPFGIMGTFTGYAHGSGGDLFNGDFGPSYYTIHKIDDPLSLKYVDLAQLIGSYSDKIIVNAIVMQYVVCDESKYYPGHYQPLITLSQTYTNRTVLIHAQSIYQRDGVTGCDWVTKGRNMTFEDQIKATIEMAYSLNGLPANEIRAISIGIEIVK